MQHFLFHKVGMKQGKGGDHCINYYYKTDLIIIKKNLVLSNELIKVELPP